MCLEIKNKVAINKLYTELFNPVNFVYLKKDRNKYSEISAFVTELKDTYNTFRESYTVLLVR